MTGDSPLVAAAVCEECASAELAQLLFIGAFISTASLANFPQADFWPGINFSEHP